MSRKHDRPKIKSGPISNGKIPSPASPSPEKVNLSFEYYEPGGDFCLSRCSKDEIRGYKDCVRKLSSMEWNEVLRSSGKGENKAGLAFTPYSDNALKGVTRPSRIDPGLQICAVRASGKMRLFGFRIRQTYYILWYDRNHEIVPT